jgi:hypothetical protein
MEEVLKIKSEKVLKEVEAVLKIKRVKEKEPSIYDFVGILSKKEASEVREAIAKTCETIDENDWK